MNALCSKNLNLHKHEDDRSNDEIGCSFWIKSRVERKFRADSVRFGD